MARMIQLSTFKHANMHMTNIIDMLSYIQVFVY